MSSMLVALVKMFNESENYALDGKNDYAIADQFLKQNKVRATNKQVWVFIDEARKPTNELSIRKPPLSITEYGALEHNEYLQYLELLNEAIDYGFSTPKELSKYIKEHKLGHKYPDIAGVIKMESETGEEWDFKGGISPRIYRYLCFDLEFGSKRNNYRVKSFKPYREI